MSMSLLTLFQFLETLAAYLFVTLAIPCAVLNKKLSHYRFMDRVLFYFIVGNFYATNLVFLLQLLHISNFYTLWIGLLVVPVIIWVRLNHIALLDGLRSFGRSGRKLLKGSMGIRSVVDDLWRKVWRRCIGGLKKAAANVRRNWLDWLLVTALVCMVMWIYGTRMLTQFGYSFSDIPVHMYWVNKLSENQIYVAGVYPFGLHAVIYLIHELFGIDTYVIFRVFSLVQCFAIHMMALLFLKLCCKSRYAAYTGVFLYTISNLVSANNIERFLATLPQETSMIYILPTAYYAFRFFQERRRELKEDMPEKDSKPALVGLIMSFSLCMSIHFYGAIIAALFCVGIAVGYLRWLVRPIYFKRIIIAALISVAVTILPMGIAFAMGKPMEGSLQWATGVITSSTRLEREQMPDLAGQSENNQSAEVEAAPSLVESMEDPFAAELAISAPKGSLLENIMSFPMNLWKVSGMCLEYYILRDLGDAVEWYSVALRVIIIFLIVAGAVLLLGHERMYGARMLSTGVFTFLMTVMFSAIGLGIPTLMDGRRAGIFFSYVLIIVVSFTVDVCMWGTACLLKRKELKDVLSFVAVIALGFCIWLQGIVREPQTYSVLESNEAIACLTSIIATEPDYSWTIFSANDENQMVFGHGYHYEMITFLYELEALDKDIITVPTDTVYFFIEKIPLDYTITYAGSGQPVSEEGAEKPVPRGNQLEPYQGENRWIVMSHMYYWAKEFQRLYPNEMKVYLETDQFICYRLEQNPYRLYDLAIDYGYNSAKLEEQ